MKKPIDDLLEECRARLDMKESLETTSHYDYGRIAALARVKFERGIRDLYEVCELLCIDTEMPNDTKDED